MCRNLPEKIGDVLTEEQYREVKELGLLVDKDDQVSSCCCLCPLSLAPLDFLSFPLSPWRLGPGHT